MRGIFVSFPQRRRRKIDEGKRQLMEVADIPAEIFLTPVFVLFLPL